MPEDFNGSGVIANKKILKSQNVIIDAIQKQKVAIIALLVVMAIITFIQPNFFTWGNMFDIVRVVSIKGIMAIGMTKVLLTGGIDLSIGSTFALSGVVAASLSYGAQSLFVTSNMVTLPFFGVIIAALGVGALIGLINGLVITYMRIEPFIATLAMMSFARGLTYLYSGGFPINFTPMPPSFAWIGQGGIGFLPVPSLFFILTILVGAYLLRYTAYGRSLYAIGGNRESARLSGIHVKKNICLTYVLMGVLAGFSGAIMTSRVASASPIAGMGYEMDVIAGVVIGGTLQSGGRGSIFGTVIGVFIFGVIENGLNIIGIPTYYKLIIKGLIIVIAIGSKAIVPKLVKKGGKKI